MHKFTDLQSHPLSVVFLCSGINKKSVYQNSHFPAIFWNGLPTHIVEQPTMEGFKSARMKLITINYTHCQLLPVFLRRWK